MSTTIRAHCAASSGRRAASAESGTTVLIRDDMTPLLQHELPVYCNACHGDEGKLRNRACLSFVSLSPERGKAKVRTLLTCYSHCVNLLAKPSSPIRRARSAIVPFPSPQVYAWCHREHGSASFELGNLVARRGGRQRCCSFSGCHYGRRPQGWRAWIHVNQKLKESACRRFPAEMGDQLMSTATTPAKAAPPKDNLLLPVILAVVTIIIAILILKIPPLSEPWAQGYDPTGVWWLSTLIAAVPVIVLLGALALHVKAHYAALLGLAAALLIAIFGFHMPARMAGATAVMGAGYGLFPIGWIVLNVIFMYQLTVESGQFNVLQHSLTGITQDRRLQLLLIAFCFGAFFEGAAGFGTPVAVTAALLIGLGFKPLQASGLSLIANTAPVAFGALGTPIIALAKVTGFSEITLGAMAGRILTPFCVLVPFWLVCAFAGWGGMLEVWPAILVAGVSFAIPQLLMSNLHGPWVVNVVASVVSMACLIGFLFIWHPKHVWTFEGEESKTDHHADHGFTGSEITRAWVPWIILSVIVFMWGTQTGKNLMNAPEKTFVSMANWSTPPSKITNPQFPVTALNNLVLRVPPVVPKPTKEGAVFGLNWLSATGTGILLAGILS